jgi:hypothetical protein
VIAVLGILVHETPEPQVHAAPRFFFFAMALDAMRLQDRPHIMLEGQRLRLCAKQCRNEQSQGNWKSDWRSIVHEIFRITCQRRNSLERLNVAVCLTSVTKAARFAKIQNSVGFPAWFGRYEAFFGAGVAGAGVDAGWLFSSEYWSVAESMIRRFSSVLQ